MIVIYEKLKNILGAEIASKIEDNKKNSNCNYLDVAVSDAAKIGYITNDRTERFNGDFWDTEKRKSFGYMGKVGRVLNRFNTFTTAEIEGVQARLLASDKSLEIIKIVKGEDIRKYYSDNYNCNDNGSLDNSCMRYEKCQEYLDIYVENCEMVVIFCNCHTDTIKARAILWTAEDKEGEQVKIVDRIYGNNESIELIKKLAKKNRWLYKEAQSYSNNKLLLNGETFSNYEYLSVEIGKSYKSYPYMDTFKYLDRNTSTLYLETMFEYTQELSGTNGNPEAICSDCGRSVDEDELHYIEESGIAVCDHCLDDYIYMDGEGYYHQDSDNIFYCNSCQTYHLVQYRAGQDSNNNDICDDCSQDLYYVEGIFYSIDDVFYCDVCNEYHLNDNYWGETEDGQYVCYYCRDEYVEIDGYLYDINDVHYCETCNKYSVEPCDCGETQ